MKKYLIIILTALILLSACNNRNSFSVKGDVDKLTNPIIFATFSSADTLAIDTIKASKNGKFSFDAVIDTFTVLTFYFNDFTSSCVVFANKGDKIKIKGDAAFPDLIQVNGNEINDDLTLFKKEHNDLLFKRGELFNNLRSETAEEGINQNEQRAQLNVLNYQLTLQAEEFVKNNPEKAASLIMINNFFRNPDNPQALERVLGYLNEDILQLPMGQSLKNYSNKLKASAEGASMPYFDLKDINGKDVISNDFRGKYLVLNFISSTDLDSRENVKILKNEYSNLNKDSVAFVSVYIDSDIYPITLLKNDSIPWTIVPEKKSWASEIVNTYNVPFIPYNIVISPSGIIKNRNIPAQEIEESIKN
jgi:peroxiredoxin